MTTASGQAGRPSNRLPRETAVMPELRMRGNRWLSFSCEESIVFIQDALRQGESGLSRIRIMLEGTHRAPLPDLAEDAGAVDPIAGTPLRLGDEITLRVRRPGLFERFPRSFFSEYEDANGSKALAEQKRVHPLGTTPAAEPDVCEVEADLGDADTAASGPRDQLDRDADEARRLFQPFDREAAFVRAEARRWASVLAGVRPDERYLGFVQRLFGLPAACRQQVNRLLDERERMALTFLLPHLHEIAGDFRRTELALSLFVPHRLRVLEGPALLYNLPERGQLFLAGEARLEERALGDRIRTGEKVVVLQIGPVPVEAMPRYQGPAFVSLATGPLFELNRESEEVDGWGDLARVLRLLCGLFVPVDVRVMLEPRSASVGWNLDSDGRGRCGVDTFLVGAG